MSKLWMHSDYDHLYIPLTSIYGYLKLPGTFPHKVTPDIDFKDDAVVQCNVPFIKIPL